MTPWDAVGSLPESSLSPGEASVAGLVTADSALAGELAPLLGPEVGLVVLDPAAVLSCPAPVHLLVIDSHLIRPARARWLSRACLPRLLLVRRRELDRLPCLDQAIAAGTVDDLLVWPCHQVELRWRVERLLQQGREQRLLCGAVLVDQARQEVWVAGEPIRLTPREFGVLRELARRCDQAVARRELLAAVWGWDEDHASNVVDVTVAGLRRKLASRAGLIQTVRGVGYRLAFPVPNG